MSCLDKVLGVKDQIGAFKAEVFFVTRTWTGTRPGDGLFEDTESQLLPTPCIRDFSHDVRLKQSGTIKQGDLILTSISRNSYPDEETFRTDIKGKNRNVVKYYRINRHYYRLINIKENFVTWDIHLRKVTIDERER